MRHIFMSNHYQIRLPNEGKISHVPRSEQRPSSRFSFFSMKFEAVRGKSSRCGVTKKRTEAGRKERGRQRGREERIIRATRGIHRVQIECLPWAEREETW